jgi:basic membrane protein A
MHGSVLGRSLLALLVVAVVGSLGGVAGGARGLRVAYVTDLGTPTDRGIGQAEYAGFARAVKRFGLQSQVVQVPPAASAEDVLASVARQRYDLVVAGPFIPPLFVATVARRYPGVKFLTLFAADGVVPHPPRNVREVDFRLQEAAYLGGFLAALLERRRPGKDVVSAVGGYPTPLVQKSIAGYQAGANAADPGIVVLAGYSYNFVDPASCRSVAAGQVARGSGAIFQVAGACGVGALEEAGAGHVWGIGIDVDQSSLGPQILTSVVQFPGAVLYRSLQALVAGTLATGVVRSVGLREHAVGLGRISPRVPTALRRRLVTVRRAIVEGRIVVPRVPR